MAGPFDLVWLDAPCTGFGTLSKLPQITLKRGERAEEEARKMAEVQRALCASGASLVAGGGAFFYTVCTLTKPETLDVARFCSEKIGRKSRFTESLWPGSPPAPHAEGFFAAMV